MRIILIAAAAAALLAGCGSEAGDTGRSKVVVTTAQLADFAREVGGDRVEVETLLDAKADPHDYEPRPSDAKAIAEADVVIRSGGEVDDWLGDVVDSAGGDADVVVMSEEIGQTGEDPHWWQDPENVVEAVKVLTGLDLAGSRPNAEAYIRELKAADREIMACMRSIPRERRKLVTSHDAFGFFAERYGIEVLGSVLPGLSTSAAPSLKDTRELLEAMRREGVTTIFPDSAVGNVLDESVLRDAGVKLGERLYADTLGPDGTYLGTLRHDAAAMARGFGGDCDL